MFCRILSFDQYLLENKASNQELIKNNIVSVKSYN